MPLNGIKNKGIKDKVGVVIEWCTGFVVLLLAVRLFEWFYVCLNNDIQGGLASEFRGFFVDLKLLSLPLLLLSLVSLLLLFISRKIAVILFLLVSISYCCFSIALIIYFEEALTILDYSALATMSSDQVLLIINLYGFSAWQLIFVLPVVVLFYLLWYYSKKLGRFKYVRFGVIFTLLIAAFLSFALDSQPNRNESQVANDVSANKTYSFIESIFRYNRDLHNLLNANVQESLVRYYRYHPELDMNDYFDYPFFSSEKTENNLADFFIQQDTNPNVVFIICESLGRIYSGEDAKLGSFTPFLDSLADEGLYWSNALANAERTFGAIPNLMGGVPEGRTGFLNLKSSMPDHLSIPLLLKENNGYQTSFFCGADESYDHMDLYLKFQKFDHIYGKSSFTQNKILSKITDNEGVEKEFNWGTEDLQVFKESIALMNSDSIAAPFFNLYLTTSFHEPYTYEKQNYFIQLAEQRIKELNPIKNRKKYFKKKQKFAALMYMDNSLRECINLYKKREDFENTIFVIVGDHSLKLMTSDARIEKYHIPLLIYSPLLKKKGKFNHVVCQKDVPAALQALLRDNFGLNMPDFNVSQSNNLKPKKHYKSVGEHVFMYSHKAMENYLYGNSFLHEEELYTLTNSMELVPNSDQELKDSLSIKLKDYKILANYVCQKNMYLPAEKYSEFVSHNYLIDLADNFDGTYTKDVAYHFRSNLSSEKSVSGKNSLSNLGAENFSLIKNEAIKSPERIRVKLKFMLFAESEFPCIYFATQDGEGNLVSMIQRFITTEECTIRSSKKEGWSSIETAVWIEPSEIETYLTINFHMPNKKNFFLDNLSLEIKEF